MKILLIDDHPLFREGVALLLKPLVEGLETWEAGSCEEGFALLGQRGNADLVLIDLNLPGLSGLDGLKHLRQEHPAVPVVVMSSADDKDTVMAVLDAGAMGFIPKHVAPEEFKQALLLVVSGGIYVPPMRMGKAEMPATPASPAAVELAAAPPPPLERLGLTPRQQEVLQGLLQGKPNKLIAAELSISGDTVKDHVAAIFRALGVNSRTQAVLAVGQMARG